MRTRTLTLRWLHWISGCLAIAAISCGPSMRDGSGAPTDGGTTPYDTATCGAQSQQIGVINKGDPPDLLVVLDRSGSMTAFPPSNPPVFTSKWAIMRSGLTSIVSSKQANIKFGLIEFPSDDACGTDGTPEVGVALNAASSFSSYFGGRNPDGGTPAHIALESALAYYNSIPVNPAGRYVLFATDGAPNCLNGDPEMDSETETVAAVRALFNAGIKTYVLGFGFGFLPIPIGVLNDAAVAGGVPKAGNTKFYEANNSAELDAVLQAISGGVIVPSCTFALQTKPPVAEDVTVKINDMVVPRSTQHNNGWDYHPDDMTITFFGSWCQTIKSSPTTKVSFVYGCPGPIIN